MPTTDEVLAEFLSSFREWHYFISGVAIGWILRSLFTLL